MQSETPPNDDRSSSEVVLDRVTHRYGGFTAVQDIRLEIRAGEFLALLGPSGCGKTTLLRIIAGLMRQSEGHVTIGGEIVDALPPNERGAGIVFQSYALFPHMTVAANIEYGLRARGMPKAERAGIVGRMLALVRMRDHAARYPRQLSGGQQQRVALARTLAVSPKVLLLDEPFGALDKNLRLGMQIEVKRLQRELGITTVMVTHDQEEALGMADRDEIALWAGFCYGAAPFSAALTSPLWGVLGDRVGRKIMVVRSLLAITVFVGLMYFARTPMQLLVLRVLQGAFSGFAAPSLTLVSVGAPLGEQGRLSGALQTAMAAGTVLGPVLGAILVPWVGCADVFLVVSALSLASAAAVTA